MSRMDLGYGYPAEKRGFRVPGFVLFLLFLGLSALYAVGLVNTFIYLQASMLEMAPRNVGRLDIFIVRDWGPFIDLVIYSVLTTAVGIIALLITRAIADRITPGGWLNQSWTIVCMIWGLTWGLWGCFVIFSTAVFGFFQIIIAMNEGALTMLYFLLAHGILFMSISPPFLVGVHR